MIKILSNDIVEINPGEVVEEIKISKKILFWEIKRTYRKVHGTVFRYKNGRYQQISWLDWDIKNLFDIPVE
tara:strand:- start:369 stop:581 length:213 start_codon:yes stop_codon:yes gene_type:complete